jgi:hypothetical protein
MKLWAASLFALTVLAPLFTACEDECGSGYVRSDHYCRAVVEGGAEGGAAGSPVGEGGAAGEVSCDVSSFSQTCLTHDQCECDADFCAGFPGEEGICTRTGCDEDPSVCPSDWGCLDLASFDPTLPTICTPP